MWQKNNFSQVEVYIATDSNEIISQTERQEHHSNLAQLNMARIWSSNDNLLLIYNMSYILQYDCPISLDITQKSLQSSEQVQAHYSTTPHSIH